MTDRRSALGAFRSRLAQTVERTGLTRGAFAEVTGIDRSTLSQLLSPDNRRLPRVDTLIAISRNQQVSVDWLLGLSHSGPVTAEMLPETLSFETDALTHNDERLIRWLGESVGYKVRYVPSTVPDLLKTEAVIEYELGDSAQPRSEQKVETAAARLAWTRRPETDLECCSSVQSVEAFARGEGIWAGLDAVARREQIEQMAALTDELYPTLRWFLFDGRARYAAPVTIFGPQRAALYLGRMYLVLTSTEHVQTCTRDFEQLIRAAIVQPPDVPALLTSLLSEIT